MKSKPIRRRHVVIVTPAERRQYKRRVRRRVWVSRLQRWRAKVKAWVYLRWVGLRGRYRRAKGAVVKWIRGRFSAPWEE